MSTKTKLFSGLTISVIITGGTAMQDFDENSGSYIPKKDTKEIIKSIDIIKNYNILDYSLKV